MPPKTRKKAKAKKAKKVVRKPAKKTAKKTKKVTRPKAAKKARKPTRKAAKPKKTVRKAAKPKATPKPKTAPKPKPTVPVEKPVLMPTTKPVEFKLDAPLGSSVSIAGDFTGWQPRTMQKSADGLWRARFDLNPGTHEYKFLVDSEWRDDPENPRKRVNEYGGYNSILDVG